jgi:O-antigen/teichoic acid export membrane protein
VARNVLHLLSGQIASLTIAFVVTVRIARHLGPDGYGVLFFSTSFVTLAFILVDLGQSYYVVSAIARDRRRTGVLLGTGMALRVASAALVLPAVWGLSHLLRYSEHTRAAIIATFVFLLFTSIGNGFSIAFRGLERMDWDALAQTGTKVLYGAASLAAISLDAGVVGVILGQAAGTAAGVSSCLLLLRHLRLPRARFERGVAIELLRGGAPFLVWSAIVAIHTTTDSILLSKLATEKVVGWYGASSRLVQMLTLPAGIIATALFPTLSRLFAHSPAAFASLTRSALKWVMYVGTLAAAGTVLFAQEAVDLVYGGRAFGPAATVLRASSPFILALFVSFVLGTAVMAANRQSVWIGVKGAAVLVLVTLNLFLIPMTDARFGNGGIGAAAATTVAEVVLAGAAAALLPRGTLNRGCVGDLGRALVAAAVMAVVRWLVGPVTIFVAVPVTAMAFALVIAALGGVRRGDLAELRAALLRR